ncbi:hypothetical protein T492DRAFT_892318 [Pavlovales sp. CCMP2436]|nr:hypothetical protein T492DRAFT_892318 [Pavlovales sp. CCMP2436]
MPTAAKDDDKSICAIIAAAKEADVDEHICAFTLESAHLSPAVAIGKEDEEEERICPFTLEPPVDPVTTLCGHVFERAALAQYRASGLPNASTCPLCRRPIPKEARAFEPYETVWCVTLIPTSHSYSSPQLPPPPTFGAGIAKMLARFGRARSRITAVLIDRDD